MGLLIRILARLMAMGALTGSGILLLICCIATPVIKQFNYSTTTFSNGGQLDMGIWGYAYYPPNGAAAVYSPTSVGYNLSAQGLPGYSANPGGANINLVNKPLSSALIFFPLATGATFLALLLSLLPIRIVTILAIGVTFLAVGATLISFVIAIICFGEANARIGLLFNPNTSVNATIGRCVWYAIAAATAETGAFLFLLIALSPAKKSTQPARAYGDPPSRSEKVDGVDYGYRKSISDRPRTRAGSAYADDYEDAHSGLERQGSRRSVGSDNRSRRSARRYSADDYERPRRHHSSSRRSRPVSGPARDAYEEDSYEPGY